MKTGIIGATILVASTTIDDAVWLVPYTTSSHLPFYTKLINGITFVATLEALSLLCVGFYAALKHGLFLYYDNGSTGNNKDNYTNDSLEKNEEHIGFIMEFIGALICWAIAIFLFVKKMLKRRRRQLQKLQQQQKQEEQQTLVGDGGQNNINNTNDDDDDDDINTIPTTPSIPIIISFTALGALDEISYFPALIMGHIFTPAELCIGALFASILILGVISLFLSQCKPLVDCLDRIPLYGIVGMFAIVLTAGLFI